ncbi:RER1B [Symbiodinium microadriaticum]|nr:RER1B [Symbiodinium microadriaticum]
MLLQPCGAKLGSQGTKNCGGMEDVQEAPAVVGCFGKLQHYVDKTTVWTKSRWFALSLCLLVYGIRVFLIQGFYIVSYGLGIYLLNLLIGFLSPAVDPEIEEVLPTTESEEFRPFTRKLPEFKFWFAAIRAVLVATVLTFLPAFDLPVFWPILLAYFIVLVVLTMKDRVRHMFKYKYVPFSIGKQTYGECAKVEVPKDKDDK